jgi:hypothetical protein
MQYCKSWNVKARRLKRKGCRLSCCVQLQRRECQSFITGWNAFRWSSRISDLCLWSEELDHYSKYPNRMIWLAVSHVLVSYLRPRRGSLSDKNIFLHSRRYVSILPCLQCPLQSHHARESMAMIGHTPRGEDGKLPKTPRRVSCS